MGYIPTNVDIAIINHPFVMVGIPPIKMVMNGGLFITAIPTLTMVITIIINLIDTVVLKNHLSYLPSLDLVCFF